MEQHIIVIRSRDNSEPAAYLMQYKIIRHGGCTHTMLQHVDRAENARLYRSKRQAQMAVLVLYRHWGEEYTFTIRRRKGVPHA